MPAKPDPAHTGPWKAAYSVEANKWYWWHQEARISSWDLPVSPEAHSPAFGAPYGAAVHSASGAQQHGGPPQADEQRRQLLKTSPEVFSMASTVSATMSYMYRPPKPRQPPRAVSMDCRACTVHQTGQKPHRQQCQQSPVFHFTAVTVPVMVQHDCPRVQQRPRVHVPQTMGPRQGLGTSSPQGQPHNDPKDYISILRRGPQSLGPWPATYHAVAIRQQCSCGTHGADSGTSAVVPVAAAARSPAHHVTDTDDELACVLCGMSSKLSPEEAQISPEANDDGHRKRRRMKKTRSSNTLGKWWRKYGYCGAAYCQKCSELFRDHLLRQISNSAHCSRECPCVDCQRVLCNMGNQTLERLWAKVDAGAAGVTPGGKKKARTAGVGVPVTETSSLEALGATFVSGQNIRQEISASSRPASASFGCGDNYPSSHQSAVREIPVRAKRETAGHYPNPVEEQQQLRFSQDRAHQSAGDRGPSLVAEAQAYDCPMAGSLEIEHQAGTPPVTDTPHSMSVDSAVRTNLSQTPHQRQWTLLPATTSVTTSVDSDVTDVDGPVMHYSTCRGDAEEWSYSKLLRHCLSLPFTPFYCSFTVLLLSLHCLFAAFP